MRRAAPPATGRSVLMIFARSQFITPLLPTQLISRRRPGCEEIFRSTPSGILPWESFFFSRASHFRGKEFVSVSRLEALDVEVALELTGRPRPRGQRGFYPSRDHGVFVLSASRRNTTISDCGSAGYSTKSFRLVSGTNPRFGRNDL